MFRHQLPSYSPLTFSALAKSVVPGGGWGRSPVGELKGYLGSRFGAETVVLTGSGTFALQLCLQVARGKETAPAEVLLPAYSCYDLATAAVGSGVRVWFYDVNPNTLAPDGRSFREGLARGPALAVVGNLYGYPLDWLSIRQECHRAGVTLVEDAAQGLGSAWEGRSAGTFGDLTVLSFGRGKGWTGGGGGALLARGTVPNQVLEALSALDARDAPPITFGEPRWTGSVRSLVVSGAQWALGRPVLFRIPSSIPGLGLGDTHFKSPTDPQRISAFSASLAFQTRDLAVEESRQRKRNAGQLSAIIERFVGGGLIRLVPVPERGESGFLRLPVVLASSLVKKGLAQEARQLGISSGYPKPLPSLPQLSGISAEAGNVFPGAEELAEGLITLPTHSLLSQADMRRIGEFFSGLA
jgi:dTDP-4-amino-4,6-dideoxygalactose transaminase